MAARLLTAEQVWPREQHASGCFASHHVTMHRRAPQQAARTACDAAVAAWRGGRLRSAPHHSACAWPWHGDDGASDPCATTRATTRVQRPVCGHRARCCECWRGSTTRLPSKRGRCGDWRRLVAVTESVDCRDTAAVAQQGHSRPSPSPTRLSRRAPTANRTTKLPPAKRPPTTSQPPGCARRRRRGRGGRAGSALQLAQAAWAERGAHRQRDGAHCQGAIQPDSIIQ